ncbi:uncharacterized protein LOC107365686 [Tetranychus urticae]|uniref:Uncharacterized protein n=1 Tax=Tetranychus urticae TaxID=32264 RepID=T1KMF7_TETUR|nr:uncharacterized protein LOC107365686 [Tetranychus urticae]
MNADNFDETVIKVKLSGEDYHDIVIDWTDTSQAYEQQVFSRLAEITGIPVEQTSEMCFLTSIYRAVGFRNKRAEPEFENDRYGDHNIEFNRERVLNFTNGNEHFGLSPRLRCDDNKHFYICYFFVPERLLDEIECTRHFCHHSDNRVFLNRLKAIVTNDALQSQMAHLLVRPRRPSIHGLNLFERWFDTYRRFNVMQYYYRTCYHYYQLQTERSRQEYRSRYMPPQLYMRTHG